MGKVFTKINEQVFNNLNSFVCRVFCLLVRMIL